MKTIKQISEELNIQPEEAKSRAKSLFSPVPPSFSDDQVQLIKEFGFDSPEKLLTGSTRSQIKPAAKDELTASSEVQSSCTGLEPEALRKLIKAKQLSGENLGTFLSEVQRDAMFHAMNKNEVETYDEVVRTSVSEIRTLQSLGHHVTNLNGTSEEIQMASLESVTQEQIEPGADNWQQYLLPPSEEENWTKYLS